MELVRKREDVGIVRLGGIERKVSLALLDNVRVGDHLIIHAGFAITVLNAEEAKETLQLLQEVFNAEQLPTTTPDTKLG